MYNEISKGKTDINANRVLCVSIMMLYEIGGKSIWYTPCATYCTHI